MRRSQRLLDGAVLDLTRQRGVITRLDLAENLGVTPATITNVVKRLLADEMLVENGHSASTGGKRRTLLQLNAASRYALGLSFDRARLTIALTDFTGGMVGEAVTALPDDGEPLDDAVRKTLTALGIQPTQVAGIGLADPVANAAPWLPTTVSRPVLSDDSIRRLGKTVDGPVIILDEATCAALGELWTGSAAETASFATVYMSEQITAGLVLDGHAHDTEPRGSLGHMSIDLDGPPCPCGARGCVDVLASPAAVVTHVLTNGAHALGLGLAGTPAARTADFSRIARAAVQGDRTCLAAITDAAAALAVGIANLVTVLGLEQIFLTGPGFADAGGIYQRVITDRLALAHRKGTPPVKVNLSTLDLTAAAIGAAALVLQSSVDG